MKFAQYLLSSLRNLFVHVHPYTPCCASCGEIPSRDMGRICSSAQVNFPVDIIFLAQSLPIGKVGIALELLQKYIPWAQNIFVITERTALSFSTNNILCVSPSLLIGNAKMRQISLEAVVHSIENLTEHYIVASPALLEEKSYEILDFFTPNGIPLVTTSDSPNSLPDEESFAEKMHAQGLQYEPKIIFPHNLYAQDKETSVLFSDFYQEANFSFSGENFFTAQARWAYAAGRAIPVRKPSA